MTKIIVKSIMDMTNHIIISVVLCSSVFLGCDTRTNALHHDLVSRHKQSLSRLDYSTGITSQAIRRDAIVAALYKATDESLSKPYIVSAMFIGDLTNKHGLIIMDWISENPGADGFVFHLQDDSVASCEMSEDVIRYNRREAETLLFYDARLSPISHPDIWNNLPIESITAVQLTKNSIPVSNVREFEIYSGGVNVTEKARGSEMSVLQNNK